MTAIAERFIEPGSRLIVDGHRSYPGIANDTNRFTIEVALGAQRGDLARSQIEGLWGRMKE